MLGPYPLDHVAIDLLTIIPQVLFLFTLSKLVDTRNPVLYWVVQLGLLVAVALNRSSFSVAQRTLGALLCAFVAPLALTKGPIGRRVLAVASCFVVLTMGELVVSGLWVALTGAPTMDYAVAWANAPAFLFAQVVYNALVAVLFAGLRMLMAPGKAAFPNMGVFAGFPLIQLAVLALCVTVGMEYFSGSSAFYLAAAVAVALCIAADVVLFKSMESCRRRQEAQQRAEALAHQLEHSAQQCAEIAAGVGDVARFRHDMRNQLQAVAALAERGERDLARNQVQCLKSRMAGGVAPTEAVADAAVGVRCVASCAAAAPTEAVLNAKGEGRV